MPSLHSADRKYIAAVLALGDQFLCAPDMTGAPAFKPAEVEIHTAELRLGTASLVVSYENFAQAFCGMSEALTDAPVRQLLIEDLGWTKQEAAGVRARLASFEDIWNAEGMDEYNDL